VLDLLVRQITINNENQLVFDTSMLFRHAHEHKDIYRKLVWGSGFKLLIKDGHAALSRKIEERLFSMSPMPQTPDIPLPILAHSVSGVLLVLLKWWLDKGLPYPPEIMDEIFQRLIMGSLRGVLGVPI
jgi:hypothetical protein